MPSTRASKVTFSCLVLAAVVGWLPPALGQGAQPAPQPSPSAAAGAASFSAEVEQVLVDVVVTDKKGVSIKDLTQPDFVVSEDGKPQSIVSFQAVEFKDPPPGERPARVAVSTNVGMGPDTTARTGRSFVIVFDDVHLTMFEAHQAKIAVAEFLQHATHESDRVTIVATGGAAWWSARTDAAGRAELVSVLKRIDGRLVLDNAPDSMSDYEAMRIHTFGDNDVTARVLRRWESRGVQTQNTAGGGNTAPAGATIDDPLVTGRATEVYFQALSRNRLTLEMVERMLHALEGVQGRKSVVLVSRGFIYDPNMDEFKRVTQSSRRANAAVYFLNAKGLEGMPAAFGAEFGSSIDPQDIGAAFAETFEASEGADSMSVESGGFVVRNTNDLTKGLKRIADDSRYYYLLGYSSTNTKRDGRFRKIQVKVARKGVELRARKGYYARLEGGDPLAAKNKNVPSNVDQALQAALDSPFEAADVPLRMAALVGDETLLGKAQTAVVADIDVDHFALEQKDGRWTGTLEFLLVVAHRESGEFLRYDQQVDMKLLPATRERMRSQWFQLSRDFELAPGGYQAKLVVRDKKSGAMGTLMHNFEVPALEPWRVSSPLLTDMLQPDPPGEPSKVPRLQPVARRSFPASATLWCSYEVYGAVKDKASGMPKVTADYVIRSAGGAELTRMPPTVIKPTSLGHLSRLTGTKLEGAAPGDYEFVITLKDELSGETMEVKEPFAVVAAGSPATAQAKTD